jgi:general secretion pathway protein G
MYKTVKRQITLIEMMIVMFLIAMIIGVVAYNYQGTLSEGKAFKTKTAKEKLHTILTIMVSKDPTLLENLENNWRDVVSSSPLVQNPNNLIKDGWGNEFDVQVENGNIIITSERYEEYLKENPRSSFGNENQNQQ